MPHSFALVVRPNLFAHRRESHNRGIYWDMNISSLDKTLRRGLVCIQIKRIWTSTWLVFSLVFLPSMKEKFTVPKIKFWSLHWSLMGHWSSVSRGWLREADNNRLYGVGHKNRWDKGALRKSWRKRGGMVLQEKSPTACPGLGLRDIYELEFHDSCYRRQRVCDTLTSPLGT